MFCIHCYFISIKMSASCKLTHKNPRKIIISLYTISQFFKHFEHLFVMMDPLVATGSFCIVCVIQVNEQWYFVISTSSAKSGHISTYHKSYKQVSVKVVIIHFTPNLTFNLQIFTVERYAKYDKIQYQQTNKGYVLCLLKKLDLIFNSWSFNTSCLK